MGGDRKPFLREQGQVCSSFCVALQEEGHICLVLGGGGLESVRHGCQRETEAGGATVIMKESHLLILLVKERDLVNPSNLILLSHKPFLNKQLLSLKLIVDFF